MTRRRLLSAAISVVAVLLAVLALEALLRVSGRGPWTRFPALAHVPRMTVDDPELGWVNAPGTYAWSPSGPGGEEVHVVIEPDGSRGPTAGEGARIDLYGGSFVFGFGVDSDETVAAQLSGRLPGARVRNRGVPGYGTLQAERLHGRDRRGGDVPDVVVYGLVELHDGRNAGTRAWLHALERAGGHHPWGGVPWVRWDGEALVEHPRRTYNHWTASEWSALVHLVELASIDVRDRTLNTKTETTVQLTRRWRDEAAPARFVVALLDAPTRSRAYLSRLEEEGIEVVDLRNSGFPTESVPGDGHPAASVHRRWAEGLAEALR